VVIGPQRIVVVLVLELLDDRRRGRFVPRRAVTLGAALRFVRHGGCLTTNGCAIVASAKPFRTMNPGRGVEVMLHDL